MDKQPTGTIVLRSWCPLVVGCSSELLDRSTVFMKTVYRTSLVPVTRSFLYARRPCLVGLRRSLVSERYVMGNYQPAAPAVPDRAPLAGIVFVLRTGIPWQMLPVEMGCGRGSTCWRHLRDWQAAGV